MPRLGIHPNPLFLAANYRYTGSAIFDYINFASPPEQSKADLPVDASLFKLDEIGNERGPMTTYGSPGLDGQVLVRLALAVSPSMYR